MENSKKSICDRCIHLPICKLTPQDSCSFWAVREAKPPLQPVAPVAEKRSFFRALRIWSVRIAVVVCLALAFVGGRLSTLPRIVSLVPRLAAPVEPGAAPDEIIKRFFQALRLSDTETLLTLAHPDAMGQISEIAADLRNDSEGLIGLQEVKILQITSPDETATALISLITKDGASSGSVLLQKYRGEWKILEFD